MNDIYTWILDALSGVFLFLKTKVAELFSLATFSFIVRYTLKNVSIYMLKRWYKKHRDNIQLISLALILWCAHVIQSTRIIKFSKGTEVMLAVIAVTIFAIFMLRKHNQTKSNAKPI